jgi:hypothetical protein
MQADFGSCRRKARSACGPVRGGGFSSYGGIVADYVRVWQPLSDAAFDFFAHCQSIQAAIEYAALSKLPTINGIRINTAFALPC